MTHVAVAELAALVATVLATCGEIPQLHRVVGARDGRGVSLLAVVLGAVNETMWIVYATHQGLWAAIPEAVLMATCNVVLAVWLLRAGASGCGTAIRLALAWVALFIALAVVAGPGAVGVMLGLAYAVQMAPALWTVWRTRAPSGVATATWAIILVESLLWGVYGVAHRDPATSIFAIAGTAASVSMLVRKARARNETLLDHLAIAHASTKVTELVAV